MDYARNVDNHPDDFKECQNLLEMLKRIFLLLMF